MLLLQIKRDDIVKKLEEYQSVLYNLNEDEFQFKFKNILRTMVKEITNWISSLKLFMEGQNKLVKQMLGKDKAVSLSQIYIELTIVKEEPREINFKDETTYNEIAYLRKIARSKGKQSVDFTKELATYKSVKPEIWCLIGNPGCGKTFLAKRTALRFSQNELTNISYSIAIACRNTDWHNMESTRLEEDRTITAELYKNGYVLDCQWHRNGRKIYRNT